MRRWEIADCCRLVSFFGRSKLSCCWTLAGTGRRTLLLHPNKRSRSARVQPVSLREHRLAVSREGFINFESAERLHLLDYASGGSRRLRLRGYGGCVGIARRQRSEREKSDEVEGGVFHTLMSFLFISF